MSEPWDTTTWGWGTTTALPPERPRPPDVEDTRETLRRVTSVPPPAVAPVTVGRILHYTSTLPLVCRAALVTAVHSQECVDLCVFEPDGLLFKHLVLHAGVGPRAGYDPGTWHWPERT